MLPPGNYELQVYSEGPEGVVSPQQSDEGALLGDIRFSITSSSGRQNLGTIELVKKATELP